MVPLLAKAGLPAAVLAVLIVQFDTAAVLTALLPSLLVAAHWSSARRQRNRMAREAGKTAAVVVDEVKEVHRLANSQTELLKVTIQTQGAQIAALEAALAAVAELKKG